jgi:hypothetical protein
MPRRLARLSTGAVPLVRAQPFMEIPALPYQLLADPR